jgi:glycerophosphoryl diester phosphodiesterase
MLNHPTIKILPVDEMRIVKRINIISQTQFDPEAVIGYVFYERQFSQDYKLAERIKNENDPFNLAPYPTQKDFPNDEIDEIILNAVREKFSKSSVRDEIMFSTFDIDQLNNFINRPSAKANFIVKPDFNGQDLNWLVGRSYNTFAKEINIYVNGSLKLIENLAFWGICDFARHEEIYTRLDLIKFL